MFRTSNGVALAAVIVANLLGGALVAQAQTTTVAGKTPGQFAVSPSGAATYRIPIEVPPGVGGVQPQLALSYNSQAGNGLVGVGWYIEGLSAITRCPRTMAEDGVRGMVNFDANDRYCLDGQRLILVNGTYGAAGSEYRTEVEGFSKITAVGTAGNGPASFVVKTKAGLTLEYGNTTDSRIEAVKSGINAPWPVGTVRVWAQNKTTDVMGNYMTTSYVEDSVNGEYYPSRMDYTGNATTSPALSPTASVQFVPTTTTRRDVATAYQAGAIIKTSKLLGSIQTYIGTTLVKDYRNTYEQSTASQKMRLLSVTECTSGNECLSPILASYTNLNIGAGSLTWNGHGVGSNGWRLVDLFGNGRMVYYTRNDFTHYATQLNEDGTAQNWTWSGHGSGDAGGDMVDLFGDGRQVYYTHNANGQHFATRLNPDGTSQSWTWNGHGVGSNGWRLANLFGNGRMVYYTRSDFTHYATQLNEDGTAQNWTWSGHGSGDAGGDMVDLFGDGRQVYYTHNVNGQHFATWFSKGASDLMANVGLSTSKQASLTFKPMTDNSVYTKDTPPNKAGYPKIDIQSPVYVVSRVSKPNGVGGSNAIEYSYGGMKAEVGTGRGGLGFRWIKAKEIETGLETYTEYLQDWPYVGLPKVAETRLSGQGNAGLIKRVTTDYACKTGAGTDCAVVPANCNASDKVASCKAIAQARVFPYSARSVEQSWDLDGSAYPTITNEVNYILNPDGKFYGEVGKVTVSTGDGYSKTTTNEYFPADVGNWILGRIKRASVTSTTPQ